VETWECVTSRDGNEEAIVRVLKDCRRQVRDLQAKWEERELGEETEEDGSDPARQEFRQIVRDSLNEIRADTWFQSAGPCTRS
jgi:hypothetical protein